MSKRICKAILLVIWVYVCTCKIAHIFMSICRCNDNNIIIIILKFVVVNGGHHEVKLYFMQCFFIYVDSYIFVFIMLGLVLLVMDNYYIR